MRPIIIKRYSSLFIEHLTVYHVSHTLPLSLQVELYHCCTVTSAQRPITCHAYLRVQELHVLLAYHGLVPAASQATNLSMETLSGSNTVTTGCIHLILLPKITTATTFDFSLTNDFSRNYSKFSGSLGIVGKNFLHAGCLFFVARQVAAEL